MSSPPDPFQNYFDSHEPRQELDSPFLNEEYLVEEAITAPTWRTPVPGFQLEGPFFQVFEEGWGAINELEEESDEFLDESDEEEAISEFESDDARSDLQVSTEQVKAYDPEFRNKSGEKFKALIELAAKKVDINPGLLAVNLLAETYRRDYLSKSKISSMLVGTDDFFEKRHDITKKVSAYADIGWDKKIKPMTDFNENGREVKTIFFNSGQDSLLASAVYLKHGEEVLRESAAKSGHNFDLLPVEIRFALTRLAFNAGHGRALKNLKQVLKGQDILIRKRQKKAGPQRRATIHAAQAIHISEKVFGIPVVNTTPEIKEFLDELYEEEFEEEIEGNNFADDFISDRSEELETEEFEEFFSEWSEQKDYASKEFQGMDDEALTDELIAELEDEDEVNDLENETDEDFEARELDPMLVRLAEKVIAQETPLVEQQVSTRWTTCFSIADIERVKKVYEENALAANASSVDRCSCIVMLNVALGRLLPLKLKSNRARSASDRKVKMGDLTTDTIEKAMKQLRRKGFALPPTLLDFYDRRNRTAGTLKPERLKASVQDKILIKSKTKGCWFAFALSIMDGYHSVLLMVDRTTNDAKIYWLDQFSSGLDDDVTNSLDQRLTDNTQRWWQSVMDTKHKGYNTTIRLWQLRKPS